VLHLLKRGLRHARRDPVGFLFSTAWWLFRAATMCFAALAPAPPPPPPPPPPPICEQAENGQRVKRR